MGIEPLLGCERGPLEEKEYAGNERKTVAVQLSADNLPSRHADACRNVLNDQHLPRGYVECKHDRVPTVSLSEEGILEDLRGRVLHRTRWRYCQCDYRDCE